MNHFTAYPAMGETFCNRKEELKRIEHDLHGNPPVLLISPGYYGKTSLALKSFEKIKWPYARVDLYKTYGEK